MMPSAIQETDSDISGVARFFWQLGGADPELLASCALHEKVKFVVVAFLHILLGLAICALCTKVAEAFLFRLFDKLGFLSPKPFGVAFLIAAFLSVLILAGVLKLLVSAIRNFSVWQVTSRPFLLLPRMIPFLRPYLPALVLAMVTTLLVALMGTIRNDYPVAGLMLYLVFVFSFLALVSPLAVASLWVSRGYSQLLMRILHIQPEQDFSVNVQAAQTGSTDTRASIHLDNSEEMSQLFAAFNQTPRDPRIIRALIEEHRKRGALADTLPLFDLLISRDPANVKLISEKASVYLELGDAKRFRHTVEQAEQIQARASFEKNSTRQFELSSFSMSGLEFFGDFTWEFKPGANILLGKNGYGKTHVLRALVAMLQEDNEVMEEFEKRSGETPKVQVMIDDGKKRLASTRSLLVFDETFGKVPVLAIPDMRYIEKSRDTFGPSTEPVADLRSQGAQHFLTQRSYEGPILSLLYELCFDYVDNKQSFDLPIFRLMEEVIGALAQRRDQDEVNSTGPAPFRFHKIVRRDNARFEILVETDEGEENSKGLPLQKASQGTLSVVAMIGLVYKYLRVVHRDVPEEEVRSQRALVIIDEIDAHLHPSWQQKILDLFRHSFPNVQFIVTAHSPLVVAGARAGEVSVMRREGSRFVVRPAPGNFIGANASDMYKRVFELEEKDPTYMRLGTLHLQKDALESELSNLEKVKNLDEDQLRRFDELSAQIGELEQFEIIRRRREDSEQLQMRNQRLEQEVLRMEGRIQKMTAELSQRETADQASSSTA